MKRQSLPHAPDGTVRWTTNTYDGLGRTMSVLSPDGASTTSYAYAGNTVTTTDPAGAWKKFTMDAMGNVTKVTEPNPNVHIDLYSCAPFNFTDVIENAHKHFGLGPWTAQYLALRLGEPDAFPRSDLGIRRALSNGARQPVPPREAGRIAEAWRPWRAYAALYLWSVP